MKMPTAHPQFTESPVVSGVLPGQDPAVWEHALAFAGSLGVPLIAAYVDPASYLIEWTPGAQLLPVSLDPALEDDDETSLAAVELGETLGKAAGAGTVNWSLRVIGGDPALALGRLAAETGASTIVVGVRRPGVLAKMDELVSGSLMHRLLTTQPLPVLGIPSTQVQRRFRSHG